MTYDKLATKESLAKAVKSLNENNFQTISVETKTEALEKIKSLIPAGASVMNGSSVTLNEIGFVDYLKSDAHGWLNLHKQVFSEKDPEKQAILRKQSTISDYYLGSVHALTENGEILIASNTGSQLPNIAFTSQNIIFVVGTQKIVPTLNDAMNRLDEYVFPLEDKHIFELYGRGSLIAKLLILKKENKMMGRNVTVLFVNEKLGF